MASGTIPIAVSDEMEKWYLTDGISESDVIAAYKFINRASWDEAKVNINEGTKYSLTNTLAIWTHCSGLILPPAGNTSGDDPYIHNADIANIASSIQACIYQFISIGRDTTHDIPGMYLSDTRWLGTTRNFTSSTATAHIVGSSGGWYSSGKIYGRIGILGANFTSIPTMYFDGTQVTVSKISSAPYGRRHYLLTDQANDLGGQAGIKCPALVLYNKTLTAAQHAAIAWNISKFGGK